MRNLDTRLVTAIGGSMLSMFMLGVTAAASVVAGSVAASATFFLAFCGLAGGFVWWWYRLDERRGERAAPTAPPRYALPQDVQAVLDQFTQCVDGMMRAARMGMDVEGALRARLDDMAAYVTGIEDELEGLRAEADKVEEIKRVASSTPRLAAKVNPDDYGVRRKAEDVPGFLTRRDDRTEPGAGSWPAAAPAAEPAE